MRKLFLIMVMVVSLYSNDTVDTWYKYLENMDMEQTTTLLYTYSKSAESGYGFTLAAIALNESYLGKDKFNIHDGMQYKYVGSYGPYHALLNTVMKRHGYKSYYTANKIIDKLVHDREYARNEAMTELLYWKSYWEHKGVNRIWSHTVGSYNAGFRSIDSKYGREYRDRILVRIKAIKKYFKVHNMFTDSP